jgi:Uma2 family endonuclease
MATPERIRMTVEEFKQLPESNVPTELIDGEVIVSPTPIYRHQEIVGDTYYFLKQIAKQNPTLGTAVVAPMDVWLGEDCVQPDVFWVSGPESRCKLVEDGYWYGAPDLVVEVLSPSTAYRDRQTKFNLYQQHGVREYWLADPEGQYVEVFILEQGKFVRQGAFGPDDTFGSPVFGGLSVNVSELLSA